MKIYIDHVPLASCIVSTVQGQPATKPKIVLFDTGADGSWMKQDAVPPGAVPKKGRTTSSATLAGDMMTYDLDNESLIVQGGSFVACEEQTACPFEATSIWTNR